MPYIKPEKRFDLCLPNYDDPTLDCAGTLNYAFTQLISYYLQQRGLTYQTINDIVGALEAAKLEFNRRIVVPYEDTKIKLNGDVYEGYPNERL